MKKILAFLLAAMLLIVLTFTCIAEVAAEPEPTTHTVNLTALAVSIIALIGEALLAWILKAIVPPAKKWLDSHTTKNQQTIIWNVVKRLVEAAEQIITGEGKGDEKLAYVESWLKQYGYDVDRFVIEAAVKEMNERSIKNIAKELDIPDEGCNGKDYCEIK